jgi:hypothetical protein
LKGDNGPPDLFPYGMAVEITAFKHLIGTFRGLDFGIRPVALSEQVGGAPIVEVRNHEPIFQVVRASLRASIKTGLFSRYSRTSRHRPGSPRQSYSRTDQSSDTRPPLHPSVPGRHKATNFDLCWLPGMLSGVSEIGDFVPLTPEEAIDPS